MIVQMRQCRTLRRSASRSGHRSSLRQRRKLRKEPVLSTSQFQEETDEVVQLSPGTSDEDSDEGSHGYGEFGELTAAEAAELRYLRQRFREGTLFVR